MDCHRITDLDDPRIAPFRNLKETNATRREGLFICEGDKLTERLLESEFEVASLLVAAKVVEQFVAVDAGIPVYVVPNESIDAIVGFNFHRGVLAAGRRRPLLTAQQIAGKLGTTGTIVVCPDVQDPENLGSILRISAAFGVDGVVLGGKTADPFSRRVLRTSMGASLRMPLARSHDLPADLTNLHEQFGIEAWATVLDTDAVSLGTIKRPDRLAILFGSEGHGLERSLVELCRRRITIPMAAGVDSLNVSVAAGIVLHSLCGLAPTRLVPVEQ